MYLSAKEAGLGVINKSPLRQRIVPMGGVQGDGELGIEQPYANGRETCETINVADGLGTTQRMW